jgi:uncharacterized protein DUF3300
MTPFDSLSVDRADCPTVPLSAIAGKRSTDSHTRRDLSGLRRAMGFSLGVLGALLVPCLVLLATGQTLPFARASSATALRALTTSDVEELVAPIALYPDALLAQILPASMEPHELLDAGNWLVKNQALDSGDRARAGEELGFSVPIRSLLQFPTVLDMMCSQMDWTRQLGEAMRESPDTVVDVVQQLRRRAMALGNLRSTLQQRVLSVPDPGGEIVSVRPVAQYIYTPIYDPQVVFTASSLERREVPGTRAGVPAVMRYVAFAAGVPVSEAFEREYGDGYASADFGAFFGGRLLSSVAANPSSNGNGPHAVQEYRRPTEYRYAYDARRLGVLNTQYFRRFVGNSNLTREPARLRFTEGATAMR